MRHPLARLVGLVAATGLLVAPLTAPSAQAADPGEGTVTVKVIDGRGHPTSPRPCWSRDRFDDSTR